MMRRHGRSFPLAEQLEKRVTVGQRDGATVMLGDALDKISATQPGYAALFRNTLGAYVSAEPDAKETCRKNLLQELSHVAESLGVKERAEWANEKLTDIDRLMVKERRANINPYARGRGF